MNDSWLETAGISSDADAIAALVELQSLNLVDVGCGNGSLARELAHRGATLLGLEPDAGQIDNACLDFAGAHAQFAAGSADALPIGDDTVDGVLFVRSLHHVPVRRMDAALREARRVLKSSGFLLVIEPEIESPFSQLMAPFHDEAMVRTAAKNALARLAPTLFSREQEYFYTTQRHFADFAHFVTEMVAATFRAVTPARIETPEVRAAFAHGRTETDYVFAQRMRINLFNR